MTKKDYILLASALGSSFAVVNIGINTSNVGDFKDYLRNFVATFKSVLMENVYTELKKNNKRFDPDEFARVVIYYEARTEMEYNKKDKK